MTSNLLLTADFSRFPVRCRFLLNSSMRSLNQNTSDSFKFTESDRWVQRLQRLPKTVCQMEKDNKIQAFYHKKTFQDIRIYQKEKHVGSSCPTCFNNTNEFHCHVFSHIIWYLSRSQVSADLNPRLQSARGYIHLPCALPKRLFCSHADVVTCRLPLTSWVNSM